MEQIFTDSMQPEDVERVIGNNQQRMDYTRIQQCAAELGVMITNYSRRHREMIDIKQIKTLEENLPVVYFRAD